MIIGYAAGAYDLFHYGHLEILRKAKENCDYLIAGVVHDDVLEVTKGRRPVIPIEERAAIVSHIDYVACKLTESASCCSLVLISTTLTFTSTTSKSVILEISFVITFFIS